MLERHSDRRGPEPAVGKEASEVPGRAADLDPPERGAGQAGEHDRGGVDVDLAGMAEPEGLAGRLAALALREADLLAFAVPAAGFGVVLQGGGQVDGGALGDVPRLG